MPTDRYRYIGNLGRQIQVRCQKFDRKVRNSSELWNCIEPLNSNEESLKQKASISVIALLRRNCAIQVQQKFAIRVVGRTKKLYMYSKWLKGIARVQVSIFGRLPSSCQLSLCNWACFSGCCGYIRMTSKWVASLPVMQGIGKSLSGPAFRLKGKNLVAPLRQEGLRRPCLVNQVIQGWSAPGVLQTNPWRPHASIDWDKGSNQATHTNSDSYCFSGHMMIWVCMAKSQFTL